MADDTKPQKDDKRPQKVFTPDRIKHIAHLARIGLSDDEALKFSSQIDSIMTSIEILNEVDTENVPETSQVTGLKNIMREENVLKNIEPDALLDCTVLPKMNHQISVKAIIQE